MEGRPYEFRMFRGALKYHALIATLQMVDLICDVALSLTDCEIRNIPWAEFVSALYWLLTPLF